MFSLGVAPLVQAGMPTAVAERLAGPFWAACQKFGITVPSRAACFFGQTSIESDGFRKMEEGLNYSSAARILLIFPSSVHTREQAQALVGKPIALANHVYAGKNGNGNEASGDGYRYRGRGLIQTTGRANYAKAEKGCGKPYLSQPDLLLAPEDACEASAFFWWSNGLNALADQMDIMSITRRVNGVRAEKAEERRAATEKALGVFEALN